MTETFDSEVEFVLDAIRSNWPEYGETGLYGEGIYGEGLYFDDGYPSDLARINRDEPHILETGDRTRSVELSHWIAVGAGVANRSTTPRGTEYNHDIETVVNVRIEGLNEREHGQIESIGAFEELVAKIRWAILQERSYPCATSGADDWRRRVYQDLRVENEQDYSHERRDYYRREFDVRLTGVEELPEL